MKVAIAVAASSRHNILEIRRSVIESLTDLWNSA